MSMSPGVAAKPQAEAVLRAVCLALLLVGGVGSSFFFACATPFAALSTLAALKLAWRDGLAIVGLVWLANQAIGFGVLDYPWTLESLAWGLASGASSVLALGAAAAFASARPVRLALSLPFVAAFAVYELGIYATSIVLGAEPGAFAFIVMKQVFVVNAGAFVVLVAVNAIAGAVAMLSHSAEAPNLATQSQ